MSQKEIREKLAGAIEYLTKNPAEARYTDSYATARMTSPDGLATEVTGPDGATIATDMPTSVGGGNANQSPGWYLRAAEASCVATLIAMRAAQEGATFEELEVTVDSESDDRGILGMTDEVPAGPLRTRIRVRVKSTRVDEDDDNVWQTIVHWAVDHCPVTDAVRRAVPLTVEISTDEDENANRLTR
jgi:uncharacterized OsmC-like protein